MVSYKIIKRRMIEWKDEQLVLALKEGNAQELEYLRKKKSPALGAALQNADMSNLNSEIVDLFINRFTDEDWRGWGFKPNSRDAILRSIISKLMLAGRDDLFDQFIDSGLDFNTDIAIRNPIAAILLSTIGDDRAAGLIGRIVAKGIDKVADAKQFAAQALAASAPKAFDILVKATATDVHINNEFYLRNAALSGNMKMARHLVEHHSSEISVAITTEKTLGHDTSWKLLESLRRELYPSEAAPPTISSLSTEIRLLRETVRELTLRVDALQPSKLDKPVVNPVVLKVGGLK